MRIKEIITESLNQPYAIRWDNEDPDPHSYDAYVKLPDGTSLTINFYTDDGYNNRHNDGYDNFEDWIVEFWRDNSLTKTGLGDQQRVFATVLSAIGQFIDMEDPETISFSAEKDEENKKKAMTRTNLYDKLVKRYANSYGYRADVSDYGTTTGYILRKIR